MENNKYTNLPSDFVEAILYNTRALKNIAILSEDGRKRAIEHTYNLKTPQEIKSYVDALGKMF